MHLTHTAIQALNSRYRAHLINGLSGFKSANLVGTQSLAGKHNLAIVSSVFHLGADPALMGMIIRPHSVARHTLENLQATGCFTLNQVSQPIYRAAHQSSARYPREVSEFAAVGLTPEPSALLAAPYVAESPVKVGLRLLSTQTLPNDTELVIGEVVEIHLPEAAVGSEGYIDIESLGVVAISGLDSYHTTERLARLSYAKPNQVAEELPVK
ncbi:MAG TPA: flavin reductase family protein [Cellvibrionaceae bacterium]